MLMLVVYSAEILLHGDIGGQVCQWILRRAQGEQCWETWAISCLLI